MLVPATPLVLQPALRACASNASGASACAALYWLLVLLLLHIIHTTLAVCFGCSWRPGGPCWHLRRFEQQLEKPTFINPIDRHYRKVQTRWSTVSATPVNDVHFFPTVTLHIRECALVCSFISARVHSYAPSSLLVCFFISARVPTDSPPFCHPVLFNNTTLLCGVIATNTGWETVCCMSRQTPWWWLTNSLG